MCAFQMQKITVSPHCWHRNFSLVKIWGTRNSHGYYIKSLSSLLSLFFLDSFAVVIDFYRGRLYSLAHLQLIILSSFWTNSQGQFAWPWESRTMTVLCELTRPYITRVQWGETQGGTKIYVHSWKWVLSSFSVASLFLGHAGHYSLEIQTQSISMLTSYHVMHIPLHNECILVLEVAPWHQFCCYSFDKCRC